MRTLSIISFLLVFLIQACSNGRKDNITTASEKFKLFQGRQTTNGELRDQQTRNANPMAKAYFDSGNARYDKQEFVEAVNFLNQAIGIDSGYAGAYYAKAIAEMMLKQTIKALEDCNKAIKLNPTAPAFYHERALLKRDYLNDSMSALSDDDTAINLDSIYVDAYLSRARTEEMFYKYKEAINDYNIASRFKAGYIHGDMSTLYVLRASDKFNSGDYRGAIEDYTTYIKLHPDEYTYYYDRGIVEIKLKEYEKAYNDFKETIKLKPDIPVAYYNKVVVSVKLGKKIECTDLQQAKALNIPKIDSLIRIYCRK